MKKAYFLSVFIWCLFALAACSKEAKEPQEESPYYEVQVDSTQLGEIEQGQFLLGQQYYQGKPVSLIADPSESGALDVYLCPMDGDKTLLISGVSSQYRSRGWYLDEKGRCFIIGAGVTRLDGDGNLLYRSLLSDIVTDICCTEKGRIILLTQKTGADLLVELDPDTGSTSPIENISLEVGKAYINSLDNDLLILDDKGVWQADLKKGTKNLIQSFTGTTYSLEAGGTITDFWADGNGANILRDSGKSERLEWVDVKNSGKEIITVRAAYPDIIKEALNLFNQSNDTYYAVLEESGMDPMGWITGSSVLTSFQTQTNLKLSSGKGADIICSDALFDDISSFIEKGIFADLAPLMEASGIREEDYSRAAFDAWRDGDKIYGIVPYIRPHSISLDKAVLNGREELTIETLVDSMLEFKEDRCFSKGDDGGDILYYFLEGSEDLWGMVDWEKGTCDFNGELFSKMLLAAKRYGAKKMQQYPGIIDSRQCNYIYEFATAKKLEAENQVELGTFFDDGNYPRSHIYAGNEIIMGINAESEHVEGAWQLLAFLLGEDAQSTITNAIHLPGTFFPVNKSVSDRLLQAELEYRETHTNPYSGETVFIPGRYLGKDKGRVVLEEQAVVEFRQILSEARTLPYKINPLLTIITEEAAYYFEGPKSIEDVIAVVQNKVQLYLNEHKTGR